MTKDDQIAILKKRLKLYQEIIRFKDMQLEHLGHQPHLKANCGAV